MTGVNSISATGSMTGVNSTISITGVDSTQIAISISNLILAKTDVLSPDYSTLEAFGKAEVSF
jgi:hypothetical protein